jgi:RNA polymerase sigma factor (sigma-70 family)
MPPTDEELLERWRSGDLKAGNDLFARYYDVVERFFAHKADTGREDLIQQTFERCTRARDRFGGRSSFRTFLLGIGRNVLREYYRRPGRGEIDLEELSIVDLGAGPSTNLARRDSDRVLLEALRLLPLRQQTLFELYYWEDLTAAEIAEVMEIPENTVRSRLRRAKDALAPIVRSRGPGQPLDDDALERWARDVRPRHDPDDDDPAPAEA